MFHKKLQSRGTGLNPRLFPRSGQAFSRFEIFNSLIFNTLEIEPLLTFQGVGILMNIVSWSLDYKTPDFYSFYTILSHPTLWFNRLDIYGTDVFRLEFKLPEGIKKAAA